MLPARLLPIAGARPRCGIPSASEAAPALDSNERRRSFGNLAEKLRRILLASFPEARRVEKLCPCGLDQNTRSKDRVRGMNSIFRAVAQLGRAPGSGPGGRGFKSHQPDWISLL